jgi:hypothetical protein
MATPAAGIWRPLVVCAHPRLGTTIGVALSELGIPAAHMVPHYPAPGKAAEIQAQHQCNICFIDVASDQARGLALIGEMAAGCAVVAINEGKEAGPDPSLPAAWSLRVSARCWGGYAGRPLPPALSRLDDCRATPQGQAVHGHSR